MNAETHSQLANFIWSICNLLRGPYKRNEYRKVILPLTVLRRFDCLLAPTKVAVLEEYPAIKKKPETVVRSLLQKITKRPFYNLSKLDFQKLLDDPPPPSFPRPRRVIRARRSEGGRSRRDAETTAT